jgi:nucleoside-diphosphate-sugar epimerase
MNYLVTGGAGFVGSSICKKLLLDGHNVFNLDIIKNKDIGVVNLPENILNFNSLEKIFNKYRFDIIIHACAEVPVTKSKNFYSVNVNGTRNIIDLFNKFPIKKLIYISSSAVYGVPKISPIREGDPRLPVEDYGKSKKQGEDLCFNNISKGKNIIIIRPRTIIGGKRLGIFSYLFDWISNDINVPVLNSGKNKYQFVNINDFSEAVILSSKIDFIGDINIGSEHFDTIENNLKKLIFYANSKSKLKNINSMRMFKFAYFLQKINLLPLQDYHFKVYGSEIYFDLSKSKKLLNWTSRYSDFESLKESYLNFFSIQTEENNSPHHKRLKNYAIRYAPFFIF